MTMAYGIRAPLRRFVVTVLLASLGLVASANAAPDGMPPPNAAAGAAALFARLAEGDALLRRGRPRAAARAFREAFDQAQGTQWAPLAELGLAWSVASTGDVELGRALAADAHASAGIVMPTTSVVFALLSARAGDYAEATKLLEQAARAATDPTAARTIRLAQAYVLFWSAEYARAVAAFDSVAGSDPTSALADDARYGAAWSRWRDGDQTRARADLERLVADAPPGHPFRSVPRRLVELDARAILAASTRGFRREYAPSPEVQLAHMLDADGFSRARTALRLITPASRGDAAGAGAPQAADVRVAADPAPAAPQPASRQLAHATARDGVETAPATTPSHPRRWTGAALLVLLAIVAWLVFRRPARDQERGRRSAQTLGGGS